MAGVAAVNPAATLVPHANIGKEIQLFTVDYINPVNGSAGPQGVQAAVMRKIMDTATIIAVGPLGNSNTEQTFMVEGNSVVVATLQAAIRTLGTFDSVDVSAATVTAKTLVIAV